MTNLFFQLLQVAVGVRSKLERKLATEEWRELFTLAKEQALVGVCMDGIERLPDEQRPERAELMQWAFFTARIEQRNGQLNAHTIKIFARLQKDGFEACLMKGQAVAQYYPNPLRRQSGDIDVWMVPREMVGSERGIDFGKCRKKVVEYAHRHAPDAEICIHNIVFPVIKNVPIELHFFPFYSNSYFTMQRVKRFLNRNVVEQFANHGNMSVPCPTDMFNMIFLLDHAFKHFLASGVGLRQIMDYYYLVRKWNNDGRLDDKAAMNKLRHDLKSLGLLKFCGAMMWVLQRVFGLEPRQMIVTSDEREGRLLLDKILSGGNFGQYAKNNPFECKPDDGHMVRFYKRMMSGMQMFWHYPSECIWNPVRIVEMFFILRIDRMRMKRKALK